MPVQNYFIFLDYLELRRRIEKRLARPHWILLHSILYVVSFGIGLAMAANIYRYYYPFDFFIDPMYGYIMIGWSIVLLLHIFWTVMRSGASAGRRSEMIELEMRERLKNDDSYLGDNPKDLFRIHGLLEEDLQKRAGVFFTLRAFAVLNLAVWLGSLVSDQLRSSFAWQVIPMLGIAFLPFLAYNTWQRSRNEGRIRKLMSDAADADSDEQPASNEDERLLHLSDDGELLDYEFLDKPKRKGEQC
jgi:hypothetical protein